MTTKPTTHHHDWRANGSCIALPPETAVLFFADHHTDLAVAREICATCPVLDTCREWGRQHREHGVWGGETETDRRQARQGRKPSRRECVCCTKTFRPQNTLTITCSERCRRQRRRTNNKANYHRRQNSKQLVK